MSFADLVHTANAADAAAIETHELGPTPTHAGDSANNASFASLGNTEDRNAIGSVDDRVRLELGGNEIRVIEDYDVQVGIFTQPSAFAVTMGTNDTIKDLIKLATPHTPFKLYIGDTIIQSGRVDGFTAGGVGATLQVHGRDLLQGIHDSYTRGERTFTETKHVDFIKAVLIHAGFKPPPIVTSNEASRKLASLGIKLPDPAVREETSIPRPVQMSLGDRYYEFIKRVLDRAGLFLRIDPSGKLILMAPDGKQAPTYRLLHAPLPNGGPYRRGDVMDFHFKNSAIERSMQFVVYARGGGKKLGSVKHRGDFVDPEMLGWGYTRIRTFRDWHVQTDDQAQVMARRKIAEQRREGWTLFVTVCGHRVRAADSNNWAIWTPDTVVHFESDTLGINDDFYIENVRYHRGPEGTRTDLTLLRREDLLFGLETT